MTNDTKIMTRVARTSLKDIARELGVSTALVSFALNDVGRKHRVSDEMIRKIKAKAAELDYHPNSAARSLRSGKSNTIGVILSDISNRFFADIARCIEDQASKNGFTVLFGSTDESVAKLESTLKVFINKGVDGLIIVPCEGSEKLISDLASENIPLVLLDRAFDDLDVNSITLDNVKATSIAVRELAAQGFGRIGYVSYKTGLANILKRETGYVETMKSLSLEDNIYIAKADYSHLRDDLDVMIPRALEDGCDSLIFSTNRIAIESLIVLRQLGRKIPDDVAVIAFDGSETFAFELYDTGISYVKQPIRLFGEQAFGVLYDNMKGEPSVAKVRLDPELVLRESSMKK